MCILWLGSKERELQYHEIIALLCELIGLHPRYDVDEEWVCMLKQAGWRRFYIERVTR